jgi:hypothetical protein
MLSSLCSREYYVQKLLLRLICEGNMFLFILQKEDIQRTRVRMEALESTSNRLNEQTSNSLKYLDQNFFYGLTLTSQTIPIIKFVAPFSCSAGISHHASHVSFLPLAPHLWSSRLIVSLNVSATCTFLKYPLKMILEARTVLSVTKSQ